MNSRRLEEKPACSIKSAPVPDEVQCSQCGNDIEIWSDETDINCNLCGKRVQHNINTFFQENH